MLVCGGAGEAKRAGLKKNLLKRFNQKNLRNPVG